MGNSSFRPSGVNGVQSRPARIKLFFVLQTRCMLLCLAPHTCVHMCAVYVWMIPGICPRSGLVLLLASTLLCSDLYGCPTHVSLMPRYGLPKPPNIMLFYLPLCPSDRFLCLHLPLTPRNVLSALHCYPMLLLLFPQPSHRRALSLEHIGSSFSLVS